MLDLFYMDKPRVLFCIRLKILNKILYALEALNSAWECWKKCIDEGFEICNGELDPGVEELEYAMEELVSDVEAFLLDHMDLAIEQDHH